MSDRAALRLALLEGPITTWLLRLAWPVLIVVAIQNFVGLAETYFVSYLGTDALAGVTLVVPLLMLMTMMSAGGIGGGVASAIARALGAGRLDDANALVIHAVVIGAAFGVLFTAGVWLGGPALFAMMGGRGEVHANSVLYANVVFGTAVASWIANMLNAALRGAGNVRVPAIVTVASAAISFAAAPLFIFGCGPVPAYGVAGAGIALACFNVVSMVAFVGYMRSKRSPLRLGLVKLEWRLCADVLKVGLASSFGTVTANICVVLITGFVGHYGRDSIAAYGVASRLDYVLIPIVFAFGSASVTMVGTNIGAKQPARALRIAWTGASITGAATALIGGFATLWPHTWMGLFTDDTQVIAAGAAYLHRVAPCYVGFGVGMALYFACQGAGKMAWPFTASFVRLAITAAGGAYWIESAHGSVDGLYWIVAAGYVALAVINISALASKRAWAVTATGGR